MSFKNRMPDLQQLLSVYGVIALMVYGWTLYWFIWKLPSWEYFLKFDEILVVFAYSMATNLLESLFILSIPTAFSLLLPKSWFKDVFISRGSSIAIAGLGYMMFAASKLQGPDYYPADLVRLAPVVVLLILLVAFIVGKVPLLRKLFDNFGDRAAIFSYIFIPISVISLLAIIARNIF